MYLKKFELFEKDKNNLKIYTINFKRVFVYSTENDSKIYIVSPDEIKIKKDKKFLIFSIIEDFNKGLLASFYNSFLKFIRDNQKEYSKKIILKGLGFRINQLNNINTLRFKLGFSHLIDLKIPGNKIYTIVKKNVLHIKGIDLVNIGNFCQKIKNLKKPNIYNGKGFRYKREIISLKTFKKK